MTFDVAVIGGGISGLPAALFTSHAELNTVVFDTGVSQIKKVPELRNVLGAPGMSGEELIETYRKQVTEVGAEIKDETVTSVKKEDGEFVITAGEEEYRATRVVMATNVNVTLLEELGLEVEVNENIKSGKIKKVVGVSEDGVTNVSNLYVSGLLAGVPSQALIAAGQGANVGVRIAQEATGDKYMWHDK